jgi:hypothetical protein
MVDASVGPDGEAGRVAMDVSSELPVVEAEPPIAREVFGGPDARSRPEVAALALAEQCPAVSRYRVFRTTMDQAHQAQASPIVEVDKSRSAIGTPLVETRAGAEPA